MSRKLDYFNNPSKVGLCIMLDILVNDVILVSYHIKVGFFFNNIILKNSVKNRLWEILLQKR